MPANHGHPPNFQRLPPPCPRGKSLLPTKIGAFGDTLFNELKIVRKRPLSVPTSLHIRVSGAVAEWSKAHPC